MKVNNSKQCCPALWYLTVFLNPILSENVVCLIFHHHHILSRHQVNQVRAASVASLRSSSVQVGPEGHCIKCCIVCTAAPHWHFELSAYPHFFILSPGLPTLVRALLSATHKFRWSDDPLGRSSLGLGIDLMLWGCSPFFQVSSLWDDLDSAGGLPLEQSCFVISVFVLELDVQRVGV